MDKNEQQAEQEQRRVEALNEIGFSLERMKEEAVRWRVDFEMDWTQDYQQYNTSARNLPPTKREGREHQQGEEASYRQTADNITRPKVIITAARLGDMLFPTNEANWALGITPVPDIPDELVGPPPPSMVLVDDGQGNQVQQEQPGEWTAETLLDAKREFARKRMTGMADKIKDQFGESKYDEHGRAAIFEACLYGTGVLYGPMLKNKKKHGPSGARMVAGATPSVEHVDLWSFFPQPSRSIDECEHVFRLHLLPKRGLRQLVRQPGFDSKQISRLLSAEPQHGGLLTAALERGAIRPDANVLLSDRFAVWQFRGPMPKEAFSAFVSGLVVQGDIEPKDAEDVLKTMMEDNLSEVDCEVWFSQGVVIKMALSTLEVGELGYYVYNYEENPNSIFGRGVAYLCRDDQHATNQLWHAMMLNSMMSAGPQIGVNKGAVETQPGRATSFAADKPRVWALKSDVADINKVFSVFIIPNVTKDIMGLYERAKQNADEHTMTPLIAQGEPTSAVPTSSGMAMLMNAANVVMRRLAKGWDDNITIPLVTAFYDWNMVNSTDESIKGDYCVIAKGASHLLIKDIQAQHLQFATQLFSTNPVLAPYMKAEVFAVRNVEMLDMVPSEMLYTEAQVQERARQAGEKPDPEVLKAQAAQATAEAAMKRAEIEGQATQARLELEREIAQMTHASRMADIQARERIQSMQVQVSNNTVYAKLMELQKDERVEMQALIAKLTTEGAKIDLGQYTADSRARVEAEKIASKEAQTQIEAKVEASPEIQ